MADPDRFLEMVEMPDNLSACWKFTGYIDYEGYGRYGHMSASRYCYKTFVCDVAQTDVIDHLCGNRLCVNPDHLEPVSRRENTHRGRRTILRPAQKEEVTERARTAIETLAEEYGISYSTLASWALYS